MNKTLGILGGGQLGMMIADAAKHLGIKTCIYSPAENSCAFLSADDKVIAEYDNKKALEEFASRVDVITYEFENIPLATVEYLENFKEVLPESNVIKISQNRIEEKSFLNKIGIKTAAWHKLDLQSPTREIGIIKTATEGYDGKGQWRIEEITKIESLNLPDRLLIWEELVSFEKEISVIVARNANGEVKCFEPAENHHEGGILRTSTCPANISDSVKQNAKNIAEKIATELNIIGIVAVEFFVMPDGELLVNETAPRPHNSGHYTMDACKTSQFEQVLRAIFNMDLGSTEMSSNVKMLNLIGSEINQVDEYRNNPNALTHNYQKGEAREGRKMGHINIIE